MGLLDLFKSEKLTIEAFKTAKRGRGDRIDAMTLMFNPASFKETHAVKYQAPEVQAINSPGKKLIYSYTPPGDLAFQLVLDGTGVNFMGVEHLARSLSGESVAKDLAKFKKLCISMNGDTHQPNFLKVSWGSFQFDCRLASLDITYKLFEQSGEPLRATLDVKFVKDQSEQKLLLEAAKSSPDLTHIRVVKSGDTLPLLCKEIYGSSKHYLRVAADNALNDFRNLTPGQRLYFKPLGRDDPARQG